MKNLLNRTFRKIPDNVREIDSHVGRFADDDEVFVIHEKESETVHTDIFVIKPNPGKNRDFYILLTSGMSALPMHTGKKFFKYRYAELVMLLPGNWDMEYENFNNEGNWWPFRLLTDLTKYPHQANTWLGYGHTFARVEMDAFSPSSGFTAAILLHSTVLPDTFMQIKRFFKSDIYIYSVIPLYTEELEYKMAHGVDALLEKFDEFSIKEIVDINRVNTCL